MLSLMLWNVYNLENEFLFTVETPIHSKRKGEKIARQKAAFKIGINSFCGFNTEFDRIIEK